MVLFLYKVIKKHQQQNEQNDEIHVKNSIVSLKIKRLFHYHGYICVCM